jgi:MoaA/NifB/PqqE/SkfB family radical SAM enzyme
MNTARKATLGARLFFNRIFGIRRPVMASWSITNRCNQACHYCTWPNENSKELDTAQAIGLIDDLAKSGVGLIVFTGGEPLLRKDLPDLIDSAKQKKLIVGINTNGVLLPKQIDRLGQVDFFQLSLDGPENVHDKGRGQGSYQTTVDALQLLKSQGRKVKLNTTITRHLDGHLQPLLEIARTFDAAIMFHPVSPVHAGKIDLSDMRMSQEQLSAFVDQLIDAKKNGAKILNSVGGLKQLQGTPPPRPPRCFWWLSINLTPLGELVVCNQRRFGFSPAPATKGRLQKAIASFEDPNCDQCWCANPTEMNLLMSFDPATIFNVIKASL